MIVIENETGRVVLQAENVELQSDRLTIGKRVYWEFSVYRHTVIDENIPYGKVGHWKYVNGALELTETGLIYKEQKDFLELQEYRQKLSDEIQKHIDGQAQNYRYDSMESARGYAGFVNAFQAEATTLGKWASECWVVAGQIEADVLAGNRAMPTLEELILELPTLNMGGA